MSFIKSYNYHAILPDYWINFHCGIPIESSTQYREVYDNHLKEYLKEHNCSFTTSNSYTYEVDYGSQENYFLFVMRWS